MSDKFQIGNTPLSEIELEDGLRLFIKEEYLNLTGSLYDRISYHIIQKIKNNLNDTITLIVPTTGHLGLSLITLLKRNLIKNKMICIIPDSTSKDTIDLLKVQGVDIVRSFRKDGLNKDENILIKKLIKDNNEVLIIDEIDFENEFKLGIRDLVDELLNQIKMNYLVFGDDSSVVILELLNYLKLKSPSTKLVLIEPIGSILLSPNLLSKDWMIETLGSYQPSLNRFDECEIIRVKDKDSYSWARRLIKKFGILAGPSSGAILSGVTQLNIKSETKIVLIFNDPCYRYHSTLLDDMFLMEHELLDSKLESEIQHELWGQFRGASVEDLQLPEATTIPSTTTIEESLKIMQSQDFSQLPVLSPTRKLLGFVNLNQLLNTSLNPSTKVSEILYKFNKNYNKYELITPNTSLIDLAKFFKHHPVGFVTDENRKWCLGVVTKLDLQAFLNRRKG